MLIYLAFATVGAILLVASLIFDGIIEGLFDGGPDWLTGVGIGGFACTLGLAGLAYNNLGTSPTVTALLAIGTAFAVAAFINAAALKLMKTDEAALTAEHLVGATGTSILGSAANAYGEILLTVGGNSLKVNGRCTDPLNPGDPVRVTAAASFTSVTVNKI